jgi:preprotein translocase subunit YajC
LNYLHILAQAATQSSGGAQPPFWANPQQWLLPIIVIVAVFMLLSPMRANAKEKKARDELLKNMKRGDRVMTIGGMLGTIVDVRDTEVVLKVDESNNTKVKFSRDAIKRVVADDEVASTK